MRYIMLLITLGFSTCHSGSDTDRYELGRRTVNWESILRANGKMAKAWHECGGDEIVPHSLHNVKGFAIVVDATLKAKNFISGEERYWRDRAQVTDTASFKGFEGWNRMSAVEKLQLVHKEGVFSRKQAEFIHALNSENTVQVWVVNNIADTISLQIQDGSFVCVLQAKHLGVWRPIEYWRFSRCGNSYYNKDIRPGIANSFVIDIPNRGNLRTRLRYKLLGKNRYFYSNEFTGVIDKYEFVEPIHPESPHGRTAETFKLDTFIQLIQDYRVFR